MQNTPHSLYSILKKLNQESLFEHVQKLTDNQQAMFAEQMTRIDPATFKLLRSLALQDPEPQKDPNISPFKDYAFSGSEENRQKGLKLIAEGKVGCLVVAGGQGTRLGFDGPKGMCPVSVIKNKTLFQLIAEKTVAASHQAERSLPLAFMTSPLNHDATLSYFKQHDLFGLQSNQLHFFTQNTLPMLTSKGDLFFEAPGKIAFGPDGNGSSLQYFFDSGLWDLWWAQGVRYINFIIIDNPLADPFDAELIGFHAHFKADVTNKCTPRRDAEEKVGSVVLRKEKPDVVEYSELSESERSARNSEGNLLHFCASISLFAFNMEFIKKVATSSDTMPWHIAKKTVQGCDEPIFKFEKYIFDVLPLANTVKVLLYPREECFAPLKNKNGNDSLQTVQYFLQEKDRRLFQQLFKKQPPEHAFELAPSFYYPTKQLQLRLQKGPSGSNTYIE